MKIRNFLLNFLTVFGLFLGGLATICGFVVLFLTHPIIGLFLVMLLISAIIAWEMER